MGRARGLANDERATVHALIKRRWSYEQSQLKSRGASLKLSEETLKRHAAETKREWKDNGRVAAYDFSPNRRGRRGRPTARTIELQDSYRETIESFAYAS